MLTAGPFSVRRAAATLARPGRSLLAPLALAAVVVACDSNGGTTPEQPNPVPTVAALSPGSVMAGGPGMVLTVTGSGFAPKSVVHWNGAERPTTFVDAGRITAAIAAADIATPGTAAITVVSPAPGGGTSTALTLAIGNPVPTVSAVTPNAVTAGGSSFTLTVTGANFVSGSVVRWNGTDRATTFVNASQLTAVIPAADIATSGVAQVAVFSPAPLGGLSSSVPVTIGNPAPAILSLQPNQVLAGGPAFTLTLNGANFFPNSVVHWNGTPRPTTYVSGGQLTAAIAAADVAAAGTAQVTVVTPAPGGGTSSALAFGIANPAPAVSSISPVSAAVGASAVTLTVNGSGFVAGSVVRWNGADRPTTLVSATQLTATIPASDLTAAGTAQVTVFTPGPGGGTSGALSFTIGISDLFAVSVPSNDIIYDPVRQRIYASVPSSGGTRANSVVAINPATGEITGSVFVGSEPGRLAIADDASFLYVALNGAASVRRVDLATFTADIQFLVWHTGTLYAEEIEVIPGAPRSVAISIMNPGSSPRLSGVAIYDDGVRRPTMAQGHTGSNRIEFGEAADVLYGYNNETTEFGLRRNTVTASGVSETWVQSNLISGFGVELEYDAGRIYSTNGAVIDMASRSRVGTLSASGFVRPDAARQRVYFLEPATRTLRSFSTTTFAPTGTVTVPVGGDATGSLIRWGTNGFAFRTAGQVIIFRTVLVP